MPNIFITGAHRSATTLLAKILRRQLKSHSYLQEPCNVNNPFGLPNVRYWYEGTSRADLEAVAKWAKLKYKFLRIDGSRFKSKTFRLGHFVKYFIFYVYHTRSKSEHFIWKDPFIIFDLKRLVGAFDGKAVVMIRNPYGFCYSVVRAGWRHPFHEFENPVFDAVPEIEFLREKLGTLYESNISDIEQAAWLWKLIYGSLLKQNLDGNSVILVNHDTFCLDPVGECGRIFEFLGLEFTNADELYVGRLCLSDRLDVNKGSRGLHDHTRSSVDSMTKWQTQLGESDIRQISSIIEPVWTSIENIFNA